ncbi:MAG: hypothetical protein K1X44_07470 [Alphaproteobacteria bacterium]|nr:hypothetical protein [Alphaproteobacteria bacterium]
MDAIVTLCNRALDLIGADPIMSLDDENKSARLCKRNYPISRDLVLRSYPWNCAMQRTFLPALSIAPLWGYKKSFPLPVGPEPLYCIRLYKVISDQDYKLENGCILSNDQAPLPILYIGRILNPLDFDPLLAEAIALRLAIYLASNLVESSPKIELIRGYFREIIAEARIIDAQENSAEDLTITSWLESRY